MFTTSYTFFCQNFKSGLKAKPTILDQFHVQATTVLLKEKEFDCAPENSLRAANFHQGGKGNEK